jgi:hypothetical protein
MIPICCQEQRQNNALRAARLKGTVSRSPARRSTARAGSSSGNGDELVMCAKTDSDPDYASTETTTLRLVRLRDLVAEYVLGQ